MPDNPPSYRSVILVAGLLGGLLGGGAAFLLGRIVVPASPAPAETPTTPAGPTADARQVADSFIAKIRGGKIDDLAKDVKEANWLITDKDFATFRTQFTVDRARFVREFGEPTGEYEYVREVALSKSLVRLIYLEKYPRDGVLWFFVLYHTQDRWRLVGVSWKDRLAVGILGLD